MEENHQVTLTEWAETKKELERAILDVKQGFVRTGYYLRQIRDGKLYEQDGYDSLAKWASDKYNLNGPTVSRLIAINEQFSEDGYSRVLDKRYEGFSFGMLVEMKDVSPEGRELITPETPREEVRELRRYEKDAAAAEPEAEAETENEAVFREYLDSTYTDGVDMLTQWERALASEDPLCEVKDIVCPAGQKMFRSGGRLIIFKVDGITIKMSFFGDKKAAEWGEFLQVARKWAADERAIRDEDERKRAEIEKELEERNRTDERREDGESEEDEASDETDEVSGGAGASGDEEEGPAGGDDDSDDPGAAEPEGDADGYHEEMRGGENCEVEVIPEEDTEIVEEKSTRSHVVDMGEAPAMPEPAKAAKEIGDLMEKTDKAYKALGLAIDKEQWKKAAAEARKVLNYTEKLEDLQ